MIGALWLAGVLVVSAQAPSGWEAERTKALQLRLDGRTDAAVASLEAAVTRYPREAGAHYELADALLEQLRAETAGGTPASSRIPRFERVATSFRRAMTLDAQYRQIASAKLVSLYEEDGFERPAEVERLSRELMAMDAASGVWAIKLAHSLAAQQRCGDASRVLVAARRVVSPDRRLLLGMSMTELVLTCPDLPLAEARPLLESADAIATEALKASPDDRDVLMMQGAALTALAARMPDGPDKQAADARGRAIFERFMEANPTRQAALRGEAPERVFDGFAYVDEFIAAGKTAEADRLLANMRVRHAQSAEFWSTVAFRHQMRGERDEAIAAMRRHVELSPPGAAPQVQFGNMYAAWAADDTAPRPQRLADLKQAQTILDAALKSWPTDGDLLISKADLFKGQAMLEQDPARKEALMVEYRAAMARAVEAYKAQKK